MLFILSFYGFISFFQEAPVRPSGIAFCEHLWKGGRSEFHQLEELRNSISWNQNEGVACIVEILSKSGNSYQLAIVRVTPTGSASIGISRSREENLSAGPSENERGAVSLFVEREIPLIIGNLIFDTFFTVLESVDVLNDDFHLKTDSRFWIYLEKLGISHCIRLNEAPQGNKPLWDLIQVIFQYAQAEENVNLDQVNKLCTMIYRKYSH